MSEYDLLAFRPRSAPTDQNELNTPSGFSSRLDRRAFATAIAAHATRLGSASCLPILLFVGVSAIGCNILYGNIASETYKPEYVCA